MISEAEHTRTIVVANIDLAIQHLVDLGHTQPPFSEAARSLTDEANVLRTVRANVAGVRLTPPLPTAA